MRASHDTTPFFTLVMPTYGVERYIADAVADVLCQTFRDFELVVVDDCTPDRSIEVVRAVAGDDPRVRIVSHEQNRGLSAARNTGIDNARGSWVIFPDPDDRYDERFLEFLHARLAGGDVDMAVVGHVQEYFDDKGTFLYAETLAPAFGTFASPQEMGPMALRLERETHLGYAWNKAYRLDLIREAGLYFEEGIPLIEDIVFNVAYLKHARAFATLPCAPYRYAKRLGANLTNEYVARYYELHRRRICEMRDLLEGWGCLDAEAKSTLGALFGRYIISALERNSAQAAHMTDNDRRAWLESVFADELFDELVMVAKAHDSKLLSVCLELLRTRNVMALIALGKAVHVVRSRSTVLYSKAKAGR